MKWIDDHRAVCNKDEFTCEKCIWIEESAWAMVQTQEYIEAKKNQPKPAKPKPELKWNYKLGRYM